MPEDHYLTIDGMRTRCWLAGQGERTVVLVHGLGGAAEFWTCTVQALTRYFRVVVPDLPGFGRTEMPPPSFSPSHYADFLAGLVDTVTKGRVILVGQSFGGAVVLDYTLRHPDRVDKLVLVASAGLGNEVVWTLRLLSLPLVGELACSFPTKKWVKLVLRRALRNPSLVTDELVNLCYGYYNRPGFRTFFPRMVRQLLTVRGVRRGLFARISENLDSITAPVLIVWGEEDDVLPVKHAYLGRDLLPRASLTIIERCGHLPFLECPGEFNRVLLEFLGPPAASPP